jgi:uncharacterized damage-inducible protein DinB
MGIPQSEPWLRGPVPGIPLLLQPAAHAFIMSIEDCEAAVRDLPGELVWVEHAGAASIGFHLRHLAGSTDRLLTYARGEGLSAGQKAALMAERAPGDPAPGVEELLQAWRAAVDRAVAQLAATPESVLLEFRSVGRAQLPSNVLGLLFHAAEHASRHTGQVVTTARILKGVPC